MAEACLKSPTASGDDSGAHTHSQSKNPKKGKSDSKKNSTSPSKSGKAVKNNWTSATVSGADNELPNQMSVVLSEIKAMKQTMETKFDDFQSQINLMYDPDDDEGDDLYIQPSQKYMESTARSDTNSPINIAHELLSESAHAHEEDASTSTESEWVNLLRENLLLGNTEGNAIDCKLAELVTQTFESKVDEAAMADKLKNIKRPANCTELKTPEVNKLMWDTLPADKRSMDCRVQKVQTGIMKTAICTVTALDVLLKNKSDIPQECFKSMVNNLSDAMTMTAYANREVLLRRKELIRPYLKEEYRPLCSPSAPSSSDYLFGDDVAKSLRDMSMASRLGHKAIGRGRAHLRFVPYHYGGGYRGRGRGRGRGYGGPFLGNRNRWAYRPQEKRGGGRSTPS